MSVSTIKLISLRGTNFFIELIHESILAYQLCLWDGYESGSDLSKIIDEQWANHIWVKIGGKEETICDLVPFLIKRPENTRKFNYNTYVLYKVDQDLFDELRTIDFENETTYQDIDINENNYLEFMDID